MRRIGMVELRRELRLAQESLARLAVASFLVQHLDHHLALQRRLLGAIYRPVAAFPDQLAQNVLAQRGP